MAQDEPSGLGAIASLFKRLFGGGNAAPTAADTPTHTNIAPPPLVITDGNRAEIKQLAQSAPFAYGYWSQVKRLYKAAEAAQDWDILQSLAARLDVQSFPEKPEMLPTPFSQANINNSTRIFVSGTLAYLLTSGNRPGLHIINISDPVQPQPLGYLNMVNPLDLVVESNTAYIIHGGQHYRQEGAVHIVDVSDPANPQKIVAHDFKYPTRIARLGAHLAILSSYYRESFLTILDVSNPQSLVTVVKTKIDAPINFAVLGNRMYVLVGERYQNRQKILTYDFTNPVQARQLHSLDLPGATDLALRDNHLFVTVGRANYYQAASDKMGLYVYRLDAAGIPNSPAVMLNFESAKSIAIGRRHAYVSFEGPGYENVQQSGLKIVDIAVPTQPRIVGEYKGGIVGAMAVSADNPDHIFFDHQNRRYHPTQLQALDICRPEQPYLLGSLPSNKTFGYMKRRVRRALRTLAEQDPAQYVQQAIQLLLNTGKDRQEIDARIQWVSMDILYGASRRYEQASHGRGAYLLRGKHLNLRTREERYPELWNRYPQQAESLYTTPELPWQTQEAACKMLRGMHRALPAVPDAGLIRFLQSPSPLLTTIASRVLAAKLAQNETVAADMAAETFFKGSGRTRKAVRDYISRQTNLSSRWGNPFANRLYKLASENVEGGKLTRRQGIAFAYLVAHFPAVLSKQVSPELTVMLYATRQPELLTWGLDTLRQASIAQLEVWLRAVEAIEQEDLRAPALDAILDNVRSKPIPVAKMRELVESPSEWIRHTSWDLIAASTTPDSDLVPVWDALLAATTETDALRTATSSIAAITLFNRLSMDGARLQGLLETRPFLVGLLPQSALQNIVRVLPVASILGLAQAATDAQWPELRRTIVNGLEQGGQIAAFWQLAWKHVGTANDPVLTARLLEDEVVSATFLTLDDPEFLNTANPLYNAILGRWVRAHKSLFAADSPALLQIATHMLPDIRAWGLEHVQQVGMRMPFALRLLESELPPAVEMGKTFFEAVPTDDEHNIEFITALCDSPKAPVRAYGREYLEARWEIVSHEAVFNRLSENTDPQMEAFLAARLLKTTERFEQAPIFDRQVLRARNQGRIAKELVKRRLNAETSQDVPLLLELARSRSSRDAEWALGQLARLALAGVEIEGVQLER